ncbi:uncharacterized protein LOC120658408 isoform X1 [Panicum virgatum]|uniref:uncharacterized protein LOC120658408 isoform X1 n=1 Tax=Panicum virgatum TaxID=38727 RepID=UPI0019D61643|nr:uncharacterized protein LOC120658408 isoform X1 [Panicum virgatum]XP_039792617.1 uncharacterized protein LOC120658408 isoform X1 [Panicum virgatum]
MDDGDLDSAALWAAVDSAAAQASRVRCASSDDDHRGEVLQPARPFKSPRLASASYATPPPPPLPLHPPPTHASPYATLDAAVEARSRLVVVESPPPAPWGVPKGSPIAADGCLLPSLSVANFRKYQEVALSILEKSDYTSISGNPYIKKSGWRKISCFFNISFEIKDHSIEFDDDHNVKRAEFLVRASMIGGRFSDGWGSCDRREKRFNKPNHDIPSTAETRAKNKACQALEITVLDERHGRTVTKVFVQIGPLP